MDLVPILCINVNIPIDAILKLDASAGVDIDANCEQIFSVTNTVSQKSIRSMRTVVEYHLYPKYRPRRF